MDWFLSVLSEHGNDAGSDYNDGDLDGWFGWHVEGDILTVVYTPTLENGEIGEDEVKRYELREISE